MRLQRDAAKRRAPEACRSARRRPAQSISLITKTKGHRSTEMKSAVIAMAIVFTLGTHVSVGADIIKEGSGVGDFAVGADKAMLTKAMGQEPNWIHWSSKNVDCLLNDKGQAIELRFNEGFSGETSKGIGIGSSEREVLKAYGKPSSVDAKKPGTKKIEFKDQGILFWINDNMVNQIVVFQAKK